MKCLMKWLFGILLLPITGQVLSWQAPERVDWRNPLQKPPFMISGFVFSKGIPLHNAQVYIFSNNHYGQGHLDVKALTQPDGRFVIPYESRCRRCSIKVIVAADGYTRFSSNWINPDWLGTVPIWIGMNNGVTLSGQVMDTKGQPVNNARIYVNNPDWVPKHLHGWNENSVAMPGWVATDEQGNFSYMEAVSGKLDVQAMAPDRAKYNQQLDFHPGVSKPFINMVMKLHDGATASGRVMLDGKQAANVALFLNCQGRNHYFQPTRSNDDGTFIFKNIRTQEQCHVVAYPGDHDEMSYYNREANYLGGFLPAHTTIRSGQHQVELALASGKGGSLQVSFSGDYKEYSGDITLIPQNGLEHTAPNIKEALYFPKSHVLFPGVRPGQYRVEARIDEGAELVPLIVTINENRKTEAILKIGKSYIRGTATGRVLDSQTHEPIVIATVTHSQRHRVWMNKPVSMNGEFDIDYVDDKLDLSIRATGYQSHEISMPLKEGTNTVFGDIYLDKQ